ncbi:DUF268 domain-containing protein [Rhodocytophaga aerolata]|uniref:DUF268 domain-containing protein n=1 Tax=Rhodocytophaga aerolata TaxID=455078 RepID=A0ABT8R9S5_9BACT|nr:DUF268 domain-containing protein [Rhodocytophaga aerolata]MDO1448846.1 DUF268 domain-containing protein [Rhodocytophaga aerolata]
MNRDEKIKIADLKPILLEKTSIQPFDSHYFYQDIWAFKKIMQSNTANHVDIGSKLDFVGFLTAITKITYIDIRPMYANLENYEGKQGSILNIPYKDNSLTSISCLHVAEHIGLGRYGDPIDPAGTIKACKELMRVLKKEGNLYFSLPVGKYKICFNAHRVHSPEQIIDYFRGLKLKELSGVDDKGNFVQNIDIETLKNAEYACGLFHFVKQ